MCGGLAEANEANEEIQCLVDRIRSDLEGKAGKSFSQFSAVSYRSQVVAGTNYFVKIHVGDEDYVHARIFSPLPCNGDTPELHSFLMNKKKADEIESM